MVVIHSFSRIFSLLQGQRFSTFNLNSYINDVQQLEKIWESHLDLQTALTAYHAKDVNYYYALKKLTCSCDDRDS